ncbi:hypothetical protein BH18CHL2_BH18CHL2_11530 [soil metagenome]
MTSVQQAPALRPLGVGDVVDRVITLYRARPLLFLTLAAIPYLLLALSVGGLTAAFGGAFVTFIQSISALDATPTIDPGLLGGLLLFVLVVVIVSIVLFAVQSASLVHAVAARYLGRDTTTAASLRAGLAASVRLIGAAIIVFLAIFVLPFTVLVAAALAQNTIVLAVASIVAVVLFFYMLASWMVVPVVATVEGTGPVRSLLRAWTLANGSRWRILGLMLLLIVLQLVISTLFSFVFLTALAANDLVRTIVQQGVNLLASILWAPVQWGTFTVLYYDLRVRREAYDLTLAAEALPREA